MGFYNHLTEDQKEEYNVLKEDIASLRLSKKLATKELSKYYSKAIRDNRADMRILRKEGRSNMSTAQKMFGDKATSALGEVDKKGLKDLNTKGISTGLKMFNIANKALGFAVDATGLGVDNVSETTAKRGGFGRDLKAQNAVNSLGGIGKLATTAAGKNLQIFNKTDAMKTVGAGFTGSSLDFKSAADLSGKRFAFGYEKAKSFLNTANAQSAFIDQIGYESEMARNNSGAELYQAQNFNKYSGYKPKLLGKKGMKFPELMAIESMLRKNDEPVIIGKFQLGGKITRNYIPEGALHKNKHHIEDSAPELEDKITEKGIPVVSMEDGGVTQHAEIEGNELTLSLPTTKKIEEYYESYKENSSDDILVECGKYFVNEVLRNTEDPGKLIKEL